MDGSRQFFCLIKPALNMALAACLLACAAPGALAETGAIMVAINHMKLGSPPSGFIFARAPVSMLTLWKGTYDGHLG